MPPLSFPRQKESFSRDMAVQLIEQRTAYGQFAPLKVSVEELRHTTREKGLLYPPLPVVGKSYKWDSSRFYEFHDTHGRTNPSAMT